MVLNIWLLSVDGWEWSVMKGKYVSFPTTNNLSQDYTNLDDHISDRDI